MKPLVLGLLRSLVGGGQASIWVEPPRLRDGRKVGGDFRTQHHNGCGLGNN